MTLTRQQIIALALTMLLVGGCLLFLDAVKSMLTPFVVGVVLAYLIDPLVTRLHRYGIPRSLGSAALVAAAISVLGVVMVLGIPMLIEQLASFLQRLPVYIMTLQHYVLPNKLGSLRGLLDVQLTVESLMKPLGLIGAKGAEWTVQAMQQAMSGIAWLVNITLLIVMTPVVAFYFLIDWPRISENVFLTMPKRWRANAKQLARDIDLKLAAYLRGTLAVCVLLGLFYAAALTGMGTLASLIAGEPIDTLEMGWAIGLVTGLLGFLPIIGGTIGILLMYSVALIQYQLQVWEPYALLAIIYMVGQILEGYVLTPMLVGNRVGLHPLWVIFALMAGATLGGIAGMMLALPVAVILSVLLPRVLALWRAAID